MVTVVLKLALLTSRMDKYATALIENLRKTSECDVALFNPRYVFYIIFIKLIKWCIVPHIIAQMDLPVDEVCIHSSKNKPTCAPRSPGDTLRNGCSLFRRLCHDQLDTT